jgi:hypothetical protein
MVQPGIRRHKKRAMSWQETEKERVGKMEVIVDFASTDLYKMETIFKDIKWLIQSRTIILLALPLLDGSEDY